MARRNLNKPIVELDKPNGSVMIYWPSSKSAADHYSINQVNISYNVNGITKQARGHYFRFATKKEIEAYENAIDKIDTLHNTESKPVAQLPEPLNIAVETIPAMVNKTELPADTLTPFEKMLQKSKQKLTDNTN